MTSNSSSPIAKGRGGGCGSKFSIIGFGKVYQKIPLIRDVYGAIYVPELIVESSKFTNMLNENISAHPLSSNPGSAPMQLII